MTHQSLKDTYPVLISKSFRNKEEWRFFFWSIFFRFEIFMFVNYVNRESDDVINCSTKNSKRISWSIKAVFFKLGTINIYQKIRHRMAPVAPLVWLHSWIQSPSVINQISPFASWIQVQDAHIILTLFVSLLGMHHLRSTINWECQY